MRNNVFVLIVLLIFLGSNVSHISAKEYRTDVNVLINGKELIFDQNPIIIDGTTLLPLRSVFEALGAEVYYDSNSSTISANKGNKNISLTINSDRALVDNKEIRISVPAQVINGRSLVPLRFVSEALGANIEWEGQTRTIYIESVEPEINIEDYKFLQLNKEYISEDSGMTVKITSIDIEENEGFDLYTIKYIQKNNKKDTKLSEGSFTAYFKDGEPQNQYGFFNDLFPTESTERNWSFKALKSREPLYIEYKSLNRNNKSENTLKWELKK